ncbi:uncharacterized protein Z520_01807 [Fonsecaea multimorphosa CBS 102226]|uniref:SDR family oxidoreductase n=1 Tax=Fonsecaea multimorphosa CBS 102226 TaxID=1442371 RepID=A0A0D2KEA8_9EURO|nr:uncharacterized protein Z520_01807 [Fonsecaea multimorphosa CBS 102226]KIY01670.1 hypothetical protein Z520_01807 [Fonsecaea multimorphosa CBS 102226]OAL29865.1 hypothetical protein AYO22_01771 [Fonsecaea multimorphosa]
MAQLRDKVIAITGAGSGIGRATALTAASRGASLGLCDVDDRGLDQVVEEIRGRGRGGGVGVGVDVVGTVVNMADSSAVDAWMAATMRHFGRLDGAANVAGVESSPDGTVYAPIVDTTDAHWNHILGINLTGLFYCLRAELRVMRRGASVVNVASVGGLAGRESFGAYSASKHGVVGITRTAAREVGVDGIRVNAICPGITQTPMMDRLSDGAPASMVASMYIPLQDRGTPEHMAKTICFALSDDADYTTGSLFTVDGGIMS